MEHDFVLDKEYIELCKLLKFLGICESGAAAKLEIENGNVSVDGEVELRKRRKVRKGQVVEFDGNVIRVQ